MSNYGIEIYNSAGQLVYSSEYKIPRVLAAGVADMSPPYGRTITVNFPPVSVRPQLSAEATGVFYVIESDIIYIPPDPPWYPLPRYEARRRLYYPFIGAFRRNSAGYFSSISFGTYLVSSWTEYNVIVPPIEGFIPDIKYTIFI